jgi:hypothetical protein
MDGDCGSNAACILNSVCVCSLGFQSNYYPPNGRACFPYGITFSVSDLLPMLNMFSLIDFLIMNTLSM